MTNLLNEEIMAIRHTISYLKKGIALEQSQSKKEEMKKNVKELDDILQGKLNQCEDYKV